MEFQRFRAHVQMENCMGTLQLASQRVQIMDFFLLLFFFLLCPYNALHYTESELLWATRFSNILKRQAKVTLISN